MEAYETLTEGINALRKQGYTEDFNLKHNCITCGKDDYEILHNEFQVDKSFRFDVNEDPSDQAVLYAISSEDHQRKGILVNSYGIYSDPIADEMLNKLK